MPHELKDRSDRFFGREKDLQGLIAHARHTGLTAIVGEPQMGKSCLMQELARRMGGPYQRTHLVGFVRYAEEADLLRRAVRDLYDRWLADAGLRQQAGIVWKQRKDGLLSRFAGSAGRVFKAVFEDLQQKAVGTAISEALDGLVAVNQQLVTGGVQLPVLQYEQARDLVTAVAEVSGLPVALFLDQFEESRDPGLEAQRLRAFLREASDWPACHIYIALQPKDPAMELVNQFSQEFRGLARICPLGPLDLQPAGERDKLLSYLRWDVPATRTAEDQALLDLIEGFPRVIYQWTVPEHRESMLTLDDLARVAVEAHAFRFSGLETLLQTLDGERRRLAVRLALLPFCAEPEIWNVIRADALNGIDANVLDDLRLARILESAEPPSLGHAKRWEAARRWFIENRRIAARQEAEALILAFAGRVRDTSADALAPGGALVTLRHTCADAGLSALPRALCEAAFTMVEGHADRDILLNGARSATGTPKVAPLLAISLFNTLNHAKAEGDLGRRDALLDELRALARAYPADAAVREPLARGLGNTLVDAKEEQDLPRRDALLDELRALARAYPADAAVREPLAMGLFNTLVHVKEEQDLPRRDALLEELRQLAGAHPEDAAVRQRLANGLFNTLNGTKEEQDLPRRDALLVELRQLAGAHPEDAAVRERLAKGLVNTLVHVKEEQDLPRRDPLLKELRQLAGAHPQDAAVRQQLAMGLFNTLNGAKEEQDLPRRDALLKELRQLAGGHPEDAAVREELARGLFNTCNDAKDEQDLRRRDALLDELRQLAGAYPDDAAVRERLAKGLFNTRSDAMDEQDLRRRDALLDELRHLVHSHPQDAIARAQLADSLVNTMIELKDEQDLPRRDALLAELRQLAKTWPDDPVVQEAWRRGRLIACPQSL